MGLRDWLLPERLPRQVVYAGDRHAEIVTLAKRGIVRRLRVNVTLADPAAADGWTELIGQLPPVDTGVILNSDPFIFNFFEFDKLPWSRQLQRELVEWKLQKIFPEDIAAYDHRFFRLNKKRILSILVKKTLLAHIEARFEQKSIPLIHIGNSTLEIFNRLTTLKRPPDFFLEMDDSSCSLFFQNQGTPIYIRKFKSGSPATISAEISRTVQFVKTNYGCDPCAYCIIDHQEEISVDGMVAELAQMNLSCQTSTWGKKTPYIPGTQ